MSSGVTALPSSARTAGSRSAARPAPRWAYPRGGGTRDLRIDLLRGLAMLFVVVDHVNIPSLYHVLSHERIGAISGAELFVTFSGLVVGLVYRRRAEQEGWASATARLFQRARLLYLVSLAVILFSYALQFVPGISARAITTWTDADSGTTYSVYPSTGGIREFPVPWSTVEDILLLRVGPSQFNVMGLYVVLLVAAPLMLRLLLERRTVLLLGVSWFLYLVTTTADSPIKTLRFQFEDAFPLLAWQLLFVHGMAAGFHWAAVRAWFRTTTGTAAIAASFLLYGACLFYTWNNPYEAATWDVRLSYIPADTFSALYEQYFQRSALGIGRLLNVAAAVVVLYALLTRFWVPINRAVGWFLVPIGQASLYVFIVQVYFTLIVDNIGVFQQGDVLINTLGHTVILVVAWLMVGHRVLFRWIPR